MLQISAVFFGQSGGEAGGGRKTVDFLSRAARRLSVRHRSQFSRQVRRWNHVALETQAVAVNLLIAVVQRWMLDAAPQIAFAVLLPHLISTSNRWGGGQTVFFSSLVTLSLSSSTLWRFYSPSASVWTSRGRRCRPFPPSGACLYFFHF